MAYQHDEHQWIDLLITTFRNRYPQAVARSEDKNLVGRLLEVMTRLALLHLDFVVYHTVLEGQRGIDAKFFDPHYIVPLAFAVECMNGKSDYTETYLENLKRRIAQACWDYHNPIIVCVDRNKNLKRLKGTFACDVEYVELGKQYHPTTTTYADYLSLKSKLKDVTNRIALIERDEEAIDRQTREAEEKKVEGMWEALQDIDDEEFSKRVERWIAKGGSEEDWE